MAAASRTAEPSTTTCNAKTRAGTPCRKEAGWGTDHAGYGRCKLHGGAAPNGRVHAAKLRVAELVRDEPIAGVDAIDRALAKLNGLVTALEQQIASGQLVTRSGDLSPFVKHLAAAVRDLAQIGKLASDAGIDERRIAIDERIAERVLNAHYASLAELKIEITPEVREITRRHFAVIQGGAAA